MFDPSVIFQRSHAGRDEIHQKSRGLTQSERLVLIMIDGVATSGELRGKLPSLTDDRFDRALQKLQKKELVLEVLMPLEGQAAEEIEPAVIDRFLQQDPLDPVTIILRDPEDELDFVAALSPPSITPESAALPALASESMSTPMPAVREPAMDAFHSALADSLAEEVRARQSERIERIEHIVQFQSAMPLLAGQSEKDAMLAPLKAAHWGYWMMAFGAGFLAGYMLAKLGG